jgi:hypothetical protein
VVEPPFAIPPIEVKQVWHKRFDGHPRLRWLRRLVAETSQNRPNLGTAADRRQQLRLPGPRSQGDLENRLSMAVKS